MLVGLGALICPGRGGIPLLTEPARWLGPGGFLGAILGYALGLGCCISSSDSY